MRPPEAPPASPSDAPTTAAWRARLREVIFEADTPLGKAFDVGLLVVIVLSVVLVMLESVASIAARHGAWLDRSEWVVPDITPQSVPGQMLAAVAMLLGYCIIAVPTGIVSAEMVHAQRRPVTTRVCSDCFSEGHANSARFCRDCGASLVPQRPG